MVLKSTKKENIKMMSELMSKKLINLPEFLFFCPDSDKRERYIYDYFRYYIPEWMDYDTLVCDKNAKVIISLVDPKTFEYRFKGKNARNIRHQKTSGNIFAHRNNIENLCDIIIPGDRDARIMTIYSNSEKDAELVSSLVDEVIEISKKEGFFIIYDTLGKLNVELMENKGFSVAYDKQFLNTPFCETVMTY